MTFLLLNTVFLILSEHAEDEGSFGDWFGTTLSTTSSEAKKSQALVHSLILTTYKMYQTKIIFTILTSYPKKHCFSLQEF